MKTQWQWQWQTVLFRRGALKRQELKGIEGEQRCCNNRKYENCFFNTEISRHFLIYI